MSYRRYLNDDLEKQMGTERTEVILSICPPEKQKKVQDQQTNTNLYCAYDQGQGEEEDLTVMLKIREMYLDTSGVVPRSQREATSNYVQNENLLTADQIVGLMLNSLLER